jgi:hypothetical protein
MDFFLLCIFFLANSFASNSGRRNLEFLMWTIKITLLIHPKEYAITEFINFALENKFELNILYKFTYIRFSSSLASLELFLNIWWARN